MPPYSKTVEDVAKAHGVDLSGAHLAADGVWRTGDGKFQYDNARGWVRADRNWLDRLRGD